MFAIFKLTWSLGEAFYCRGSFSESLYAFLKRFPSDDPLLVFSTSTSGTLENLRFVAKVSSSRVSSFRRKHQL